ncbi:glycosyltransferase family 2 protein [Algoriphagus aquimarinus]|uniref:Glycosyltransferase, GT2 family n=1 Tax=Algoriphagus aquimarinus TaxID=237018 RepID=A0A1I1CHV5_9BACT|nr:glycosyltransferase family A protein [Algoriphagus aquimarinus]SFB60023.1 Glycosyltransferase, GT2 family [Algoriphagus aquimarinus]
MNISIIIPSLNRPIELLDLIGRLNQVVKNEEVIIVDDSAEIQEEDLYKAAKFSLVYLNRGKPLGVSSARNYGARKAKGNYLLFFDDDDDFTVDWLSDFEKGIANQNDFIQCEMKFVYPNKKEEVIRLNDKEWKLVIPGAWMIKKELFDRLGGFDERLKFAENTELFLRINAVNPTKSLIPKANFIYNQSIDGGSKNLQNMIDSNLLILEKHNYTLTNHTKHLYHQVVGVNQLRFRRYSEARKHLWKAFILKPFKVATLARFLISLSPLLVKKLYSKEVNIL